MKKFDNLFKPELDNPYWQRWLYRIIFGTGTPLGRAFDIMILISILISTLLVMLESIERVHQHFGPLIHFIEWCFTILFFCEYVLRVLSVKNRTRYLFNFYAVIDLIALLPGILILFTDEAHSLMAVRVLRLLRVYRLFKMDRFILEADVLRTAIRHSMPKILVFLQTVLLLAISVGSLMYIIEGPEAGFTSIPRSIYWAVVTLTTVGYGDIAPQSPIGQVIALILMIMGYGIIAVPTGIVSAQFSRPRYTRVCHECGNNHHADHALYCHQCGAGLKKN